MRALKQPGQASGGSSRPAFILRFDEVTNRDVALVGGKNASLGELTRNLTNAGIRVPPGFALTAHAYRSYVRHNGFDNLIAEQYRLLAERRVQLSDVTRTVRHRLNRGGDRALNRALHDIVITRWRVCPQTQDNIARRRAEGKSDREIRRCLKRYVARELHRELTRTMT